VVIGILISKAVVVSCGTGTPLVTRTNCFNPKVGILIGY